MIVRVYTHRDIERSANTSKKQRGGGVLVATKKIFNAKVVRINCQSIEQVFVRLTINKTRLILGCVYIPPSSDRPLYELHCETVEWLLAGFPDHYIILAGDYNLPDARWSETGGLVHCHPSSSAKELFNCFSFLNLKQTNYIPNNNDTFLDLVFSNFPELSVSTAVDRLLDRDYAHHIAYSLDLPITLSPILKYNIKYYDFRNADLVAINDYLASVRWDDVMNVVDVNTACERFYECIYSAIDLFVPVKTFKNGNFPCWFSPELRKLVVEKKIAHQQFKQTSDPVLYEHFSMLRGRCKSLEEECYRLYVGRVENELSVRPKMLWKHIKNVKRSANYPERMHFADQEALSGGESVDLFADFFESVYADSNLPTTQYPVNDLIDLNSITVDLSDIFNELVLSPHKLSSGPDGIPPFLLKHCVCTVTYPLWKLLNLSLCQGVFPSYWKCSYIVPIHKSGDRENVENYRGISIQSAIAKVFDKLVTKQLSAACNNIVINEQHGFHSGRSTQTNLLQFQHYLTESIEGGHQVDCIYTDYSKAFDRVPHCALLQKLRCFGLGDRVLEWLRSFLLDRFQCVRIGNFLSRQISAKSGVPQGSHCGPLLFKLFTNDVVLNVSSPCLLFADDMKLYRVIRTSEDACLLQEDLNCLVSWSTENSLNLNISKCTVITFTRKQNFIHADYVVGSTTLSRSYSIKDLGVLLDSQITFVQHIDVMVASALKRLGFVLRHGMDFSPRILKLLYFTFVRSSLEYCSTVWSPYYGIHVNDIERVQGRFLRTYAHGMGLELSDMGYTERCQILGFDTMESRRLGHELIFLHKLINGFIDSPYLLSLLSLNVSHRRTCTRNHDLFKVGFHRTNYGFYSPLSRMQRNYNTHCDTLDLSSSLAEFRKKCHHVTNL